MENKNLTRHSNHRLQSGSPEPCCLRNKELPKNYIDEKTGIEYSLIGDYYIPNLVLPNRKNITLGKYGRMRAKYLKENNKAEYSIMLIENTLQDYLIEIDKTANERFELLMKQFIEKENITEELKATNQLEWVGKMNSIKQSAEEIVLNELIYV